MGYKPSGAAKSRREEDGEAPSEETGKGPHRLAETGDRAVGAAVLVTAMASPSESALARGAANFAIDHGPGKNFHSFEPQQFFTRPRMIFSSC